jgi:protein O-mannosyl-transferase
MRAYLKEIGIGLALVVANLVIFAPTRDYGFVNFDDDSCVGANASLQAGLTPAGLRWAFTTLQTANWQPLTWISYLVNYQLHGLAPGGYHLGNVLLHTANSVLLFLALRRMTAAVWPSALAAALFAVHPLHVESVAWVAERKDVLSTFFGMLTVLAYASYAERPGWGRYLLVVGLLGLGLLAKPMLVTLPCVLLLLDYWPLGRFGACPFPRLLGEKLPLLALSALSCGITWYAQRAGGAVVSLEDYPLAVRVNNALVAYGAYVGKAVWPAHLAALYTHPGETLPPWEPAVAGLGLGPVTALAWWQRRRRPYLIVGWLWFLGTLVPVIGLVQVGMQAMADRYTYIPLIGLSLMAAWALADLAGWTPEVRAALAAAAGLWLVCLTLLARVQVGYWGDSITLWEQVLRVEPESYVAQLNLTNLWLGEGHAAKAVEYARQALHAKPNDGLLNSNLASALDELGEHGEAEPYHRRAVQVAPNSALAHYRYGLHLAQQPEHLEEAVDQFSEALRLNPTSPDAYFNLGLALGFQRKPAEAIIQLGKAVRLRPKAAPFRFRLAMLLQEQGRISEAVAHYRRVLELDSSFAEAADRLAWILATDPDPKVRDGSEAVRLAHAACEATGYCRPEALDTLAAGLAESGQFSDACAAARQALARAAERDPDLVNPIRQRLRLYETGKPCHGNFRIPHR